LLRLDCQDPLRRALWAHADIRHQRSLLKARGHADLKPGVILPEPGFHDALRRLARESGTLLAIDETHTLVSAYAGLSGEWDLDPDFLPVGKSIAGEFRLGVRHDCDPHSRCDCGSG
jgi:hypothetical protein